MLSSITFHPFISHFPTGLLFASFILLYISQQQHNPKLAAAASFNLSIGLLMAVMAALTGMVSADINLRTNVEIEGHQGYSLLLVIFYAFSTGYSYNKAYSPTALMFYGASLVALIASVTTGYQLVFSYR